MRKWLTIFLLLMPTIVLGQASYDVININYKADNLNFNTGNGSKFFNLVLTGNVNTSGLNGGSLGMEVIFNICQDNVGGRTFNWPPNVINPPPINSAALACTSTRFVNIGNFQWTNTGNANGTGAGTPAAGSPPQTQVNDPGNPGHFGGTPCENFPSLTLGPINADCDWHSKGPNPYTDVTRFGVRSLSPTVTPAATGITATINSGSTSATVSTSSCPSQANSVCFVNGDGVVIYGAGTAHSLATPAAPTITPSLAIAGTGTGFVTNGPTGATNYCARIVARTKQGGLTAAGPETCIATSQATLGVPTPVSITSMTRSNDVVSVTTGSAHGFLVGCTVNNCGEVYITGSVDVAALNANSFNGWWAVASAVDSTHFTFTSAQDTRGGAILSATGGTAQWFNCNHVTWTQVAGAWEYYIYTGATGAETLRGVSRPQGTTNIDLTWDDFGSPMMDNFSFPAFVPTAFPVSATANHLVTTIVSGAGTTTLTLAVAASTSVAGATIRFDNAPNILAAATAVSNRSNGGVQGGAIYFPLDPSSGNNFYVVNSYLDFSAVTLANTVPVSQAGQIWLNETWELGIGQRWSGDRNLTKGAIPQFSPQSSPITTVFTAMPGFYVNNGNLSALSMNSFTMNTQSVNGALLIFAEGFFNFGFDHLNLSTSVTSNDYMGIAIYLRGAPGGGQSAAFGKFTNILSTSGSSSPTQDGFTHTPNIFCNDCGATRMEAIFMAHRNIFFRGDPAGGSNLTIDLGYTQGSVQPFLTTTLMGNAIVRMCNVTLDTTIHGDFTSLPALGVSNSQGQLVFCDEPSTVTGTGGSVRITSGLRVPISGLAGIVGAGQTTNPSRSSSAILAGSTNDGTLGVDTSYVADVNEGAVTTGPLYPILVSNATPPAPTCSVSAGGSVTAATYRFIIMPAWQNGSEGIGSYASSTCTVTPGNQTVTINWSSVPGSPKTYTLYASSGGGFTQALVGIPSTSTSAVISSAGVIGFGGPLYGSLPSGGPTMLMPGVQGIATPQMIVGGSAAITGVNNNPGAVVATGYQNSAYDNFNRANETPLSNGGKWTQASNSVNLSGNTIIGSTGGNQNNVAFWNATPFANDQFAQAVIVTLSGNIGPSVRVSGTNNWYSCLESTTQMIFQKNVNGAASNVTTTAITGAVGDIVRIEVQGTTVKCFQNGAVINTTTDSQLTSGSVGMQFFNNTGVLDNWSGGNLHPIAQLDTEQDWTQPQHFTQPVTIGTTNPIAGTLALGVYSPRYTITGGAAPTCAVTGAGTGATCTLSSFSTDNSGAMQINSGTTPGSSGTWTLTFSAGFPNAAFCTVGPGSGGTVLNARATVFDNTNGTLGVHSGVWDNNAVAINASQAITFIISYICGGH